MSSSHDRYPYRPIIDRPVYDWSGGRHIAIYLGVNYEVSTSGGGLGAKLAPSPIEPDVMNYAWRDYRNRPFGACHCPPGSGRIFTQTAATYPL